MASVNVVGIPKSGTTALTRYLDKHTRVHVTIRAKHLPFLARENVAVVHIIKHPIPWLPSWVDYDASPFTRADLEQELMVRDKVVDWAARAVALDEAADATVTHQGLITRTEDVLQRVEALAGVPTEREGPVALDRRRWGAPGQADPFDPSKYTEKRYLTRYDPDILLAVEAMLLDDPWGEHVFERLRVSRRWWRGQGSRG